MKNYFFFIGLPRARTSWLANFFTYADSFCYHEATRFCHELGELKELLDNNKSLNVGNSDPALIYMVDDLIEVFPKAKIVVVERDFHECVDSYLGFFPTKSYLDILSWMEKGHAYLEKLKNYHEFYTIKHDDLDNMEDCQKLWNYILQSISIFGSY